MRFEPLYFQAPTNKLKRGLPAAADAVLPDGLEDDEPSETETVYRSLSRQPSYAGASDVPASAGPMLLPSVSDALSESLPPLPRRNMTKNRPLVAPIHLAGSEMERLLEAVTQPAISEGRKLPRVLKIRLSRRRTFSEEDIWRMVYLRFGSLSDFGQVQRNYNEVAKCFGTD